MALSESSLPKFEVPGIMEKYLELLKSWPSHSLCQKRMRFFAAAVDDLNKSLKIDRIVCAGIGSFDRNWNRKNGTVTSLHQLIELELVLNLLQAKGHLIENREVYFQDPMFNTVDRCLLLSRDFRVVNDPALNDLINPHTFFYAPFVPGNVVFFALEKAFPALYIGTKMECVREGAWAHESWSKEDRERLSIADRFEAANNSVDLSLDSKASVEPSWSSSPIILYVAHRLYWRKGQTSASTLDSDDDRIV